MKKLLFIIPVIFVFLCSFFLLLKKEKLEIDNIFFVSIDTLRADHLGCYGYVRNTSPFIDSLAKKGILFERVYSQIATTSPSHASIFTGLYPSQHGVVDNGYILDDSFVTLAEVLKDNGFITSAFTSTDRHFLHSNIHQGFEFYEEPEDTIKSYGIKYRQANFTINNAISWLNDFNIQDKLFMWIHLFDPHLPYNPPKEYWELVDKDISQNDFLSFIKRYQINIETFNNSIEKMYEQITNYDAEIRYVDEVLKKFFNFVEKKGLNKKTLWIITADHGEALGQHDWLEHGKTLYQDSIHVPLLFFFTEDIFPSKRINKVIEVSSIFKTVLDILDIKLDKNIDKEVLMGSFFDKIDNKNSAADEFAFSERRTYEKRDFPKDTPPWEMNYEEGKKYSLQNEKFKLIYNTVLGEELYNLHEDPFETNNIAGKNINQEYQKLREIILEFINLFEKTKNQKGQKVDQETIKKLKALGYIH